MNHGMSIADITTKIVTDMNETLTSSAPQVTPQGAVLTSRLLHTVDPSPGP